MLAKVRAIPLAFAVGLLCASSAAATTLRYTTKADGGTQEGYVLDANQYYLGNIPYGTSVDIQSVTRDGSRAYGRINSSAFGQWSDGAKCGFVWADQLDTSNPQMISTGDVCKTASVGRPSGAGLISSDLYYPNTYSDFCGGGCVQPGRIVECPDPRVYANYDPVTRTLSNVVGTETPGRGTSGYSGVTVAVAGFGTRYVTMNRDVVLIKDTGVGGNGSTVGQPAWKFIRDECVAGDKIGQPVQPGWYYWDSLGGGLNPGGGGAIASWAPGRLDVFVRGTNDDVHHIAYDAQQWRGWEDLGRPNGVAVGGDPDAVSWGYGRVDAFVRDANFKLAHVAYDGGSWVWDSFSDGLLTSSPSVASWAAGRLDVFARGTGDQLFDKAYDRNTWFGWSSPITDQMNSEPASVSWGFGRIDVFWKGPTGTLRHIAYDQSRWVYPVDDLGGQLTSGPTVASWGPGRLDVFVRVTDDRLWHRAYANSQWYGWELVGPGRIGGAPAAVSWGPDRIDVVARGRGGAVWHAAYAP